MNLSENKKIIGIQQPEIKKTVGALSGAATRSLENDQKLYMDFYTTYLAEKNEYCLLLNQLKVSCKVCQYLKFLMLK